MHTLPRVWWIGTSLVNFFLFYAAGNGDSGLIETTHSLVISSYTLSIKALMYARESISSMTVARDSPPKLLIITIGKPLPARNLPGTKAEKLEITTAVGSSVAV
jgi:hypothetical protein